MSKSTKIEVWRRQTVSEYTKCFIRRSFVQHIDKEQYIRICTYGAVNYGNFVVLNSLPSYFPKNGLVIRTSYCTSLQEYSGHEKSFYQFPSYTELDLFSEIWGHPRSIS